MHAAKMLALSPWPLQIYCFEFMNLGIMNRRGGVGLAGQTTVPATYTINTIA